MTPYRLDLEISRTAGMGEIRVTCQRMAEDGHTMEPVPLAGWTAFAHGRKSPSSDIVIDLAPVIAPDDTAGLITIPPVSHTAAADLPLGEIRWDIILEKPDGSRVGPIVAGVLAITTTFTRPEA